MALRINSRLIAFIAVMSALGNILGAIGIPIPAPIPEGKIVFHLSQLPALLVAVTISPIAGAVTGVLSLLVATIEIGNPFVLFGNAILAGVTGLAAKRFRVLISGIIGEIIETPYLWFSIVFWMSTILGIPVEGLVPFIVSINIKAFIEVGTSCIIIEVLLKSEIKKAFEMFRGR